MKRQAAIALTVVFLWLCRLGVDSGHGEATQNFVQVAFIPDGGGAPAHLSGYDTDHDGREELLVPSLMTVSSRLYEHTGNNQYEPVLQLPDRGPWAAGDIDGDGLSDIVVQTYDSLEVFESPAPDSYPSQCVWQWEVPYHGNAALTWITDLDQDGRREILVSHFGVWVYVFEHSGGNMYTRVFEEYTCPPACGIWEVCHGDFDLDGKMEFVLSDSYGRVATYENTTVGVDSFSRTWLDSLPIANASAVAAANDMDQDGKPEFIIGGTRNPGGWHRYIYTLFETTGDNGYESVWSDSSLTGGIFDYHYLACGDVDGDTLDEMVFGLDRYGIALYKCNGPDSYERMWEWHTGQYICDILIYDLNKNGYGEIVVCAENGTWIFEMELPGVNEMPACPEQSRGDARLLQNFPNPFRTTTTILFSLQGSRGAGGTDIANRTSHITLAVYDITGRLVASLVDEEKAPGSYTVTWNRETSDGRRVLSGVYFYRLQVRGSWETRKMVVLK